MTQKKVNIIGRTATIAALVLIAAVLFLNSFYTINEQQQAVITTFGKPSTISTPGPKFKIPFIQKVTKVTTTTQGMALGYDTETNESLSEESLMITKDYNFINADFYIEYRVTDPIQYLYASDDPKSILKMLSQSYIRDTIGVYPVDSVMTTGKNEIQTAIKDKLFNRLEQEQLGLQITNLTIQDVEPPTPEVISAFKYVETARQGKETEINNANKYRSEQMPAALATVDKITKDADAQKQARVNEAKGQVERFNAMYTEYTKNPTITKQRMYYEAMEQILPGLKVVIGDGGEGTLKFLPLDGFAGKATSEPVPENKEDNR